MSSPITVTVPATFLKADTVPEALRGKAHIDFIAPNELSDDTGPRLTDAAALTEIIPGLNIGGVTGQLQYAKNGAKKRIDYKNSSLETDLFAFICANKICKEAPFSPKLLVLLLQGLHINFRFGQPIVRYIAASLYTKVFNDFSAGQIGESVVQEVDGSLAFKSTTRRYAIGMGMSIEQMRAESRPVQTFRTPRSRPMKVNGNPMGKDVCVNSAMKLLADHGSFQGNRAPMTFDGENLVQAPTPLPAPLAAPVRHVSVAPPTPTSATPVAPITPTATPISPNFRQHVIDPATPPVPPRPTPTTSRNNTPAPPGYVTPATMRQATPAAPPQPPTQRTPITPPQSVRTSPMPSHTKTANERHVGAILHRIESEAQRRREVDARLHDEFRNLVRAEETQRAQGQRALSQQVHKVAQNQNELSNVVEQTNQATEENLNGITEALDDHESRLNTFDRVSSQVAQTDKKLTGLVSYTVDPRNPESLNSVLQAQKKSAEVVAGDVDYLKHMVQNLNLLYSPIRRSAQAANGAVGGASSSSSSNNGP